MNRLACAALALAASFAGSQEVRAIDLEDLFEMRSQAEARSRNVLADEARVYDRAPAVVAITGFGRVSRNGTCLRGADCSRRPVTAGTYLLAKERAPWIVWQSHIGQIRANMPAHAKGSLTAFNVIEAPSDAIRPGGLHVRNFGVGALTTRIRD